jgi:hypothetical protein
MGLEWMLETSHHCHPPYAVKGGELGEAIYDCLEELATGELWVTNDEYDSQVNYCPWCGYKARTQIPEDAK